MNGQSQVVGAGTPEFAAALLQDLFVSLRRDLARWAAVTHQTPQARMGYIGQHLVSVVTGLPGGRSGARGDDLKHPDGTFSEIKCCYRVDQLGECPNCGARVASIETRCPNQECNSEEIIRKDDSKWLLSPKDEKELIELFEPARFYFVLFEFVDIGKSEDIDVKIYEVDPNNPGFRLCMLEYYYNIRAKSNSSAPFNLWPHSLKFALMKPTLIYWSVINADDSIETRVFPNINPSTLLALDPFTELHSSKTLKTDAMEKLATARMVSIKGLSSNSKQKRAELLSRLQQAREAEKWDNSELADQIAELLYAPLLAPNKKAIAQLGIYSAKSRN